jgi:hypothetical protein
MPINLTVCRTCISQRRDKPPGHTGNIIEGVNDRVMPLHGIVKCRKKWLSETCSEPPEWCAWKLEHVVSREK